MEEEKFESWDILNKYKVTGLILILVAVSFYLGSMSAKIRVYEKQLGIVKGSSANIGNGSAPTPVGSPPDFRE
jgi:hypothetical protein